MVKTVKVELKVDNHVVYTDSNVDKNTTNKLAQISGKGIVKVELIITDSTGEKWTRSEDINFNNTTSINF